MCPARAAKGEVLVLRSGEIRGKEDASALHCMTQQFQQLSHSLSSSLATGSLICSHSPSFLCNRHTAFFALFRYNHALYRVPQNESHKILPMLLPGLLLNFEVQVQCLDPNCPPEAITVLILNPESAIPFVTAIVTMPPSDVIDD